MLFNSILALLGLVDIMKDIWMLDTVTIINVFGSQVWLFSTLCDNFCLWNREMLTGQDF